MTWQPIETAPKDNYKLILAYGPVGMVLAWWDDDEESMNPRPLWRWRPNLVTKQRNSQPTHWMPLPEPPK